MRLKLRSVDSKGLLFSTIDQQIFKAANKEFIAVLRITEMF